MRWSRPRALLWPGSETGTHPLENTTPSARSRLMKAVLFDQHGGPEVLRFAEVATPAPRPGHVLVRVMASGVNAYDAYLRGGHFPYELRFPHVLGADIVGQIVEAGAGVPDERAGQKVIVAPGFPLDPHDDE